MTRPTNQEIIDAWQDSSGWASKLAAAATGMTLPGLSTSGQIEVCSLLNQPSPGGRHSLWEQAGDGAMQLSSLTISQLTDTAIAPATFPDNDHVNLPVTFTSLQVDGRYSYSQPCQLWDTDVNKKSGDPSPLTGTGRVTQSASSGQLVFVASIDDSAVPMRLQSVYVTNSGSVSVTPDQSGPGWFNAISGFLTGWSRESSDIAANLGSVLAAAPFTTTMIANLNAAFGPKKGQPAEDQSAEGRGEEGRGEEGRGEEGGPTRPTTIDGAYDVAFVRGSSAATVATIEARAGRLTGRDVRGIRYAGTYRQDPGTGTIAIRLSMDIPASTRLVADVVSPAAPVTVPVAFDVPVAFLAGEPHLVPVDLADAGAGALALPHVLVRVRRAGGTPVDGDSTGVPR